MKRVMLTLALTLALPLAAPAVAQERSAEDGLSLMEQGARLFMQGILNEMEPALDDLRGLAAEMEPHFRELFSEMGPAFFELFGQVDDFSNYEPPVFLPNGDIILRRRPDAPEWVAPDEVEIDL
jgi:hypothetical protein